MEPEDPRLKLMLESDRLTFLDISIVLAQFESVHIQPQLTQWIRHGVFWRPHSHVSYTLCLILGVLHSNFRGRFGSHGIIDRHCLPFYVGRILREAPSR